MRVARSVLVVVTAGLLVACHGSGTGEPTAFAHRSPLPSCGTFTLANNVLTAAQKSMIDCIVEAARNGTPKELDYSRPGTDCCHMRFVIRVLGAESVEEYTATDGGSWYRSKCRSVGPTGEPFGYVHAVSCDPPESL
jgi:hypothetical protein